MLLRPSNDGWKAVILEDREPICSVLPFIRITLTLGDGWQLGYLVQFPSFADQFNWEPVNMVTRQVNVPIPHDIRRILVKHL